MLAYNGICIPDIRNIAYIELPKSSRTLTIHLMNGKDIQIFCEYAGEADSLYSRLVDEIKCSEIDKLAKFQTIANAIKGLKHIKLEHIEKSRFYTWEDAVLEQRAIARNMQPAPTPSNQDSYLSPAEHWIPWDQITLDDILVHEAIKYVSTRTFNCLRNYERRCSSPNASILFKNINKKDLMRERNFGKLSWQEVSDMYEAIKKKGGIKV